MCEQYPPEIMPYGFGVFEKQRRNKTKMVEQYLLKHGQITPQQIEKMTQVRNPADCIKMLRNKGYHITTNPRTGEKGTVYVLK